MASKQQQEVSSEDIEELLDAVDKTMDRLKTLYEQYFLGIQKQPPTFIHSDVERKLRDLTQLQIRNTGLRYRFATLQQKFGSYNSYWRRTLRQIENGTYARNLSKIGRDAARTGAAIPEEILAAMPKRMREQVVRDRDAAIAIANRRKEADAESMPPELSDDVVAVIKEPTELRRSLKTRDGAHVVDQDDDFDLDAFFKEVEAEDSTIGDEHPTGRREEPIVRGSPPPAKTPVPSGTQPGVARTTQAVPRPPIPSAQSQPLPRAATPVPPGTQPGVRPATTQAVPRPPTPSTQSQPLPRPAIPGTTTTPVPPGTQPGVRPAVPLPARPVVPQPARAASQTSRPNPIAPGAAAARGAVPVESMHGPFPREQSGPTSKPSGAMPPIPRPTPLQGMPAIPKPGESGANRSTPARQTPAGGVPASTVTPSSGVPIAPQEEAGTASRPIVTATRPTQRPPTPKPVPTQPVRPAPVAARPGAAAAPPQRPPPGMTDADVNALYAKYVKAKEMVGEKIGPGEHNKLLRTINAQAPKIMQQYNAKAVDFSVVVKDNQVIIRAKPKT